MPKEMFMLKNIANTRARDCKSGSLTHNFQLRNHTPKASAGQAAGVSSRGFFE